MEIIPWSDAFLVGQEPTDNEHRKLIKLANTFLGAFRDGKSQNILAVVLDELISFSREHFRREEVELRRHDRLGFIAQKDHNDALYKEMIMFKDTYVVGKLGIDDITPFLQDWLVRHIAEDVRRSKAVAETG